MAVSMVEMLAEKWVVWKSDLLVCSTVERKELPRVVSLVDKTVEMLAASWVVQMVWKLVDMMVVRWVD